MTTFQATTFGEMLRTLRLQADLTQQQLGQRTGYSAALISRLESNARCPDMDMLQLRFISALGLSDEPALANRLLALAQAYRTGPALAAQPAPSAASDGLSTAILLMLVAMMNDRERTK